MYSNTACCALTADQCAGATRAARHRASIRWSTQSTRWRPSRRRFPRPSPSPSRPSRCSRRVRSSDTNSTHAFTLTTCSAPLASLAQRLPIYRFRLPEPLRFSSAGGSPKYNRLPEPLQSDRRERMPRFVDHASQLHCSVNFGPCFFADQCLSLIHI